MRLSIALLAAVTVVAGIVSLAALRETSHQRSAACAAVLVSLDGIVGNARAGIRPVQTVPAGLPPELRAAFKLQRQATIQENRRRIMVIREMRAAVAALQAAQFCNEDHSLLFAGAPR